MGPSVYGCMCVFVRECHVCWNHSALLSEICRILVYRCGPNWLLLRLSLPFLTFHLQEFRDGVRDLSDKIHLVCLNAISAPSNLLYLLPFTPLPSSSLFPLHARCNPFNVAGEGPPARATLTTHWIMHPRTAHMSPTGPTSSQTQDDFDIVVGAPSPLSRRRMHTRTCTAHCCLSVEPLWRRG